MQIQVNKLIQLQLQNLSLEAGHTPQIVITTKSTLPTPTQTIFYPYPYL